MGGKKLVNLPKSGAKKSLHPFSDTLYPQEFKLKADRRSVIIRAVGFTVEIVERGFRDFHCIPIN